MAKHFFQITFVVSPQSRSSFQESLGEILQAYSAAIKDTEIRVLGSFIGEGNDIILEIGLNSLGDMDAWSQLPDAVLKTHGQAKGKTVLENFAASVISSQSRVLSEFVLK
ncbi:hypothetical protein EI171_00310 (plasmid) [Bradyrhizobium sp. LCT2]|uniref:hypothetical protein n=1 Tax=Bradyrhizobium sp. LCT2 TaxID=2493093 RepID=UPI0013742B02|nr:hypothetical protein [Bradyrhizobium sp. LCT2]QHP66042.1 hypothetical protein EI171_00310 [Bradyrhizobium sp. LCT2]